MADPTPTDLPPGVAVTVVVRSLDARDLGVALPDESADGADEDPQGEEDASLDTPPREPYASPVLDRIRQLLEDGYAGVIFAGPPGTGKTREADLVSLELVDGDESRRRVVQFHPSYQYEDFVEGYTPGDPNEGGGFRLVKRHLLQMCERAREVAPSVCVLVIEEISRADPSRVFGEALTFIEGDKRERTFALASGRSESIPKNLIILATMNDRDRNVSEVDVAFERRFARYEMPADGRALATIMENQQVDSELRASITAFFEYTQGLSERARVGHGYFAKVRDRASLDRLWEHQLRHYMRRAFGLDEDGFIEAEKRWIELFPPLSEEVEVAEEVSQEEDRQDDTSETAASDTNPAANGEAPTES